MLLAGDERRNTQQREQQRLLPGQRALVARLGARRARRGAARVHEARAAPPGGASGLPALRLPHRRGAAGLGRARRLVVPARRPQDDAGGLGARRRLRARRVPQRRRDPDARPRTASRRGRLVPRPLQRLARAGDVRPAAGAVRPPLGARALHRRPGARAERHRRSPPARPCRSRRGRCASCAASADGAGRGQSPEGGGCVSTRRQTATTRGSNCVPAASCEAPERLARPAAPRGTAGRSSSRGTRRRRR